MFSKSSSVRSQGMATGATADSGIGLVAFLHFDLVRNGTYLTKYHIRPTFQIQCDYFESLAPSDGVEDPPDRIFSRADALQTTGMLPDFTPRDFLNVIQVCFV